jgi:hypothetical protein
MATVVNVDINQNLSSSTKKPSVTSNLPNFGKRVHISANGTPTKTFSNRSFSLVDSTIFPEAKLQFNIPTVKINYPLTFKLKVSHNTSLYNINVNPYKQGTSISVENIPTYIYCDTVTDPNKNESTYIINLESNFFTTSPPSPLQLIYSLHL